MQTDTILYYHFFKVNLHTYINTNIFTVPLEIKIHSYVNEWSVSVNPGPIKTSVLLFYVNKSKP